MLGDGFQSGPSADDGWGRPFKLNPEVLLSPLLSQASLVLMQPCSRQEVVPGYLDSDYLWKMK